jgi:deoxyribose-phosphate aldolase
MSNITVKIPSGGKLTIPHYPIDAIGIEERAQSFTKRSIKNESKLEMLYLALSMCDLTTLEGSDTKGKVQQLCTKAIQPATAFAINELSKNIKKEIRPIPSTAAVCVYQNMVPYAKKFLEGTNINIAAVSTGFPAGAVSTDIKLRDVKKCIDLGATEIDMVIDRGAFLSGNYQKVFDEIVAVKAICNNKAHLKVILETGELVTYDNVRIASMLSMHAGADFIKTSTGKVTPAATLPVTLVMLQAILDYKDETGIEIGMKPAGGIRTSKQALHYLCMVNEVMGDRWMHPDMFRFGASALVNDLLKQIFKLYAGKYYYSYDFAID